MDMIEILDVSKTYDGFMAVHPLSFNVKKGEVLSIIGPNGAGKTTTIKMICGMIQPTSGTIRIKGVTDDLAKKRMIGYMPEENALYEGMGVREYLEFFAELYDVKDAKRIDRLLKLVNLPDKAISSLSKGMRRKVLLARSLLNDPEILIYDEPASGLDPVSARNLLDEISRLRKAGKTIIMSAHDLSYVEEISDNLIIMNKGKIDLMGSVPDVKKRFGRNRYTIRASGRTKAFAGKQEMLRYIRGRDVEDIAIKEPSLQEIFVHKFKNG